MATRYRTRSLNHVRRQVCVFAIIASSYLPTFAYGQDWITSPTFSVSSSYETNPELREEEEPNSVYILNPSIVSQLEFPTSSIEFDASATITRSRDQTIDPDTEQFNIGGTGVKTLSLASISGSARVELREFANSEFDDNQALSSVDTNVANENDTILRMSMDAGVSRELTNRITGNVGFNVKSVEFSDETRTDSLDYRLTNGYSYALNDVLSATSSGSIQYFVPADDEAVVTLRVSGGASYVIDEDHSVRGSVGIVSNETDTSFTIDWSQTQSFRYFTVVSSSVFDLAPNENGQLQRSSSSTIRLSRPLTATISGQVGGGYAESEDTETLEFNGSLSYSISDFVTTSLAASIRQSTDIGTGTLTDTETTDVVVTPTVNWILNEQLSAVARYDEIRQAIQGSASVNSRRGTLSLNYNLNSF